MLQLSESQRAALSAFHCRRKVFRDRARDPHVPRTAKSGCRRCDETKAGQGSPGAAVRIPRRRSQISPVTPAGSQKKGGLKGFKTQQSGASHAYLPFTYARATVTDMVLGDTTTRWRSLYNIASLFLQLRVLRLPARWSSQEKNDASGPRSANFVFSWYKCLPRYARSVFDQVSSARGRISRVIWSCSLESVAGLTLPRRNPVQSERDESRYPTTLRKTEANHEQSVESLNHCNFDVLFETMFSEISEGPCMNF